jgi:hypothetical protein
MVNTLWKDVPYSIAILAFTYLLLRLAATRGAWLAARSAWALLGITAALAALFRHNGLPVIAFTFVLLLLTLRQQWKPLLAAFVTCLTLYYGITGPVYTLMRVERTSELVDAATSLYSLAAGADDGSAADQLFVSMNPLSNAWQCSIVSSLGSAGRAMGDKPENLPQKALNLLKRSPSLLAYDYRCNRSLAWIIWDPNGEVRNPSHAEYWIDPNPYNILPNSKIPALQPLITQFVARTAHNPSINWLFWRPALYLYIFLAAVALAALRQKNIWLLVVTAPALAQSVSFTLINMPPNFRYHYAIYLLGLAFWPMILMPQAQTQTEQPMPNS